MAQAPIEDPLSGHAESSTAATIFRNADPLTIALRNGAPLEMDDIARLERASSSPYNALSSLGTPSSAVFSSKEESTITKPTSVGTPYPYHTYNVKGKGKGKATYASSLSVGHGSGSEGEAQHHTLRRDALFAMGNWATGQYVPAEPLKGAARSKTRYHYTRQPKHKKPIVKIIQHVEPVNACPDGNRDSVITIAPALENSEKKYLRARGSRNDDPTVKASPNEDEEQFVCLAGEGQPRANAAHTMRRKSLSGVRVFILIGIIIAMITTIAGSAIGANHTGKARMGCTKGIVFGATVLVASFTVLALITARRAPQEALLAGLLEIVIGFALLAELEDFM